MKQTRKAAVAATTSPMVDMTRPRAERPLIGLDIEEWRGELDLSKYQAQYALGFRNSNHYNNMCWAPILPVPIEILLRLYEESPIVPGWDMFKLKELFELMYSPYLEPFVGSREETFAKVDLGTRFTKLFDRSSARHYQWLRDDPKKSASDLSTYSDVECILSKLKQVENPGETLERIAKRVWQLRGVNLDSVCPIPTLEQPPTRRKTGRKSGKPLSQTVPMAKAKPKLRVVPSVPGKPARKVASKSAAPVKTTKVKASARPMKRIAKKRTPNG